MFCVAFLKLFLWNLICKKLMKDKNLTGFEVLCLLCVNLRSTSCLLFSVCLRWRLHFEFVTSCDPIPELERPERPDMSAIWCGPANLNVETMIWDLPIKIYPTNPLHACSSTQLKTNASITL